VLLEQGRYDEAVFALQDALKIAGPALGPDHPLVAIYTINLGASAARAQDARGDGAAELLLRDGLRIRSLAPGVVPSRRRTFVDDDWSVGAIRDLLGRRSSRSGATTKPRPSCSTRNAIWPPRHLSGVN
jgi:hypothetical protein